MKVENMTNNSGNKVAKQFIIVVTELSKNPTAKDELVEVRYFQSYDTIICRIECG